MGTAGVTLTSGEEGGGGVTPERFAAGKVAAAQRGGKAHLQEEGELC